MTEPLIIWLLTIQLATTQVQIEYPTDKLCIYAKAHIRKNPQVVLVSCEAKLQTIKNGVSE
jgi:hypothetical protein